MTPDRTRSLPPASDLDAGLAAAFGPSTTRHFSRPPLLRDDPSDFTPVVRPDSADMPAGDPGPYQLLGEIARGGMGVILKGRDPDLGRDLAVKVLKAELAGKASAEQRFVEEAQVGGQLQHPGIVPVYALGRFADGRPYFTMKLVKGRTLAALLTERGTPVAHAPGSPSDRGRFLKIFEKICETIAYAHSKGVIHRDLKPANVMVGNFGEVQVMDWGLAKVRPQGGIADEASRERKRPESADDEPSVIHTARGSGGSETQAGSVLGTPAYMPPEQAGGEIDKLDERADVFGLGAILCVILTADPPYRGETAEEVRLMAVRGKLADALARLDACGADADLIALCKRCLSPERDDRPRHAGEVAAAVTAYLAGVEERARRAELERAAAEVRTAEQRKRWRVQAGLGMALTAVVGLVGFGLWWQERHRAATEASRAARQARTAAEVAGAVAETQERITEAWKLIDYPDRIPAAADASAAAFRRAEGFAAAGEPTAETLAALTAARDTLDDLNRHSRFIIDIDQSKHQFATELADNVTGSELAHARRCQQSLQRFGLNPIDFPEEETATTIARSRLRDALLGTLLTWQHHTINDPAVRKRLGDVIRSVRLACGGTYARWQNLLDGKQTQELATFAVSPEALTFNWVLIGALGRDLLSIRNLEAARALLRAATNRYPFAIWLHYDLALVCDQMNPPNRHEALRHRAAAAAVRPDSAYFQMLLGRAYLNAGAVEQGMIAFRRAVEMNPKSPRFLFELGIRYAQVRDYTGAESAFRRAVALDPESAAAQANLARVLFESARPWAALTLIEEALQKNPKWVDDPISFLPYNAACAAVRCAAGQGTDIPAAADSPALRRQAHGRLTGYIAAWQGRLASDPTRNRSIVHLRMRMSLTDPDLASVRHPLALAFLPADERAAWQEFWADVRKLRDETAAPPAK